MKKLSRTRLLGPCACQGCRAAVYWTGHRWSEVSRSGRGIPRKHACPEERPVCGALMRNARERCARKPGHGYEHRSLYALENARRKGLVAA